VSTAPKTNHLFTGVHAFDENCVFVRGVLRDLDERRVPHTFVMRSIDERWSRYFIHDNVTAQCTIHEPARQTLSLCFDGVVHIDSDEGSRTEHVDPSGAGPNRRRWMWDIRLIGGSVYAVGMLRMVYRRNGNGLWVRFGQGLEMLSRDEVDAGLRSIDGIREDHIYAVGLHGEIWHFNGERWTRRESPTNVRLERVRCLGPALAYACGGAGIILHGENNQWSVVEQDETEETFWDMAFFAGKLFLATTEAVYVLDAKQQLSKVNIPVGRPIATNYLAANQRRLWSVGGRDIVVFDGDRWTIPNHPLDDGGLRSPESTGASA
jgi:hypothetical protein